MAVAGTPELCNVLNLHNVASRAAGVTTPITWDVYVGLLIEQAEVHDAANTSTSNPKPHRMVNNHELDFDNNEDNNGPYDSPYEVAIHDFKTPIKSLMIHQMDRGPQTTRRVSLNRDTWRSLSKDDQVAWDRMSDAGKKSIVTYAKNRGKISNKLSDNKPANQTTTYRSVNNHEAQSKPHE